MICTYGYDSLNRLTSISYNTSGASGVATTPNVTYNYDTNQSSSTNGLLLSLAVGTGYSESYSYDSFKRVQSVTRTIDGRSYTSSYQQDTANQLTQMTYPSNRVINLGHDNKGRVTSVGSYLTGVTYNGIGQLTGGTLGNGVTESYGYDTNRMQLTSETATQSGGPAGGLMNLTYGYQASAGQMGAGTTAGNAGQLMSIGGTKTKAPEGSGLSLLTFVCSESECQRSQPYTLPLDNQEAPEGFSGGPGRRHRTLAEKESRGEISNVFRSCRRSARGFENLGA